MTPERLAEIRHSLSTGENAEPSCLDCNEHVLLAEVDRLTALVEAQREALAGARYFLMLDWEELSEDQWETNGKNHEALTERIRGLLNAEPTAARTLLAATDRAVRADDDVMAR